MHLLGRYRAAAAAEAATILAFPRKYRNTSDPDARKALFEAEHSRRQREAQTAAAADAVVKPERLEPR